MQARLLPARHGALWLLAGLRLFRRNPPLLGTLTLGYVFLVVAIKLLPLVGQFLLPLALPALAVVIANGCRAIERGAPPEQIALARGLRERRTEMLQLGGLYLLGFLAVRAINTLFEEDSPLSAMSDADIAIAQLRLLIIATPVTVGLWFAPLLAAWDGVSPSKAVFFSVVAAWRNWRAFAVYGATTIVVAVVVPVSLLIAAGALYKPLGQALSVTMTLALVFVAAPVLMASVYLSYQDVFHPPAPADA
jgi:hypothetical protein